MNQTGEQFTKEELKAIQEGIQDKAQGRTIPDSEINWNKISK